MSTPVLAFLDRICAQLWDDVQLCGAYREYEQALAITRLMTYIAGLPDDDRRIRAITPYIPSADTNPGSSLVAWQLSRFGRSGTTEPVDMFLNRVAAVALTSTRQPVPSTTLQVANPLYPYSE